MIASIGELLARWQSRQLFARFSVEKEGKLARTYLDELLEQSLLPVIERVVRRRLSQIPATQEGDDDLAERVRNRALAYLIPQLYAFRESRAVPPDLLDLSTHLAKQAFSEAWEERHTERRRLRHRLLYIFHTHPDRFTLQQDPLWGWWISVPSATSKTNSARWQELQRTPLEVAQRVAPERDAQNDAQLGPVLARLLSWLGHRVTLEELLEVTAELRGISFEATEEEPSAVGGPTEASEAYFLLRQLWIGVLALPVRQRIIVLLGLSDTNGASLLDCLSRLGVASEDELAQALEIGAKSYALLRRELPCDDSRIAELLKSTPEGIAALRHVARARLMSSLVLWGQA